MQSFLRFASKATSIIFAFTFLISSRFASAFHPTSARRLAIGRQGTIAFASTRLLNRQQQQEQPKDNNYISSSSSASEEDLARWEDMYNAGSKEKDTEEAILKGKAEVVSEIRVVTFDLDNTVWKTGECIQAANDALAKKLEEDNIIQTQRVEKIMGDLFKADKLRYAPLDANATAPVLLTKLRTDAIESVLKDQNNNYDPKEAAEYATKAFDLWTTIRHDAIPDNMAQSVLETLDRISSIKSSSGSPVLIGAITDGNSDPRRVESLKQYFDFCINAETVGACKPEKRVYLEAARHVLKHPLLQDLGFDGDLNSDDAVENAIGPYWVHIGDDFLKDIVAAKSLNMRTIWAIELIRDKVKTNNDEPEKNTETKDLKEFIKELSEKKTIVMSLGDDYYLADAMRQEFIDGVAEQFQQLGDILWDWHSKANPNVAVPADNTKSDPVSSNQSAVEPTENTKSDPVTSTGTEKLEDPNSEKTEAAISVILPEKNLENTALTARAFRLVRGDCTMDVPAPILNRESRTMKEVMMLAQMDKSSGVFAFPEEDVAALKNGKMTLMIKIGGTDLELAKDIFTSMTVQEVLSFSEENPVTLTLYMKKASEAPSFDLF